MGFDKIKSLCLTQNLLTFDWSWCSLWNWDKTFTIFSKRLIAFLNIQIYRRRKLQRLFYTFLGVTRIYRNTVYLNLFSQCSFTSGPLNRFIAAVLHYTAVNWHCFHSACAEVWGFSYLETNRPWPCYNHRDTNSVELFINQSWQEVCALMHTKFMVNYLKQLFHSLITLYVM